jgi:S1-C subfamily serine protease
MFSGKFAHPRVGPLTTFGHVSAINQATVDNGLCQIADFMIDATVGGGMSGGPVYNEAGEVIGMTTAGLVDRLAADMETPADQDTSGLMAPRKDVSLQIARALPMDRVTWSRLANVIGPHVGSTDVKPSEPAQ